MEKRLKQYLQYMESLGGQPLSDSALKRETEELLVQIRFFQHERLVHLIVTVTFAVLVLLALLGGLFAQNPFVWALVFLLLVLLAPYVRHYYILENGVQKLYEYYDALRERVVKP